MKKKILLIAVVIFVSLGLLSISKIVQNNYLNKKSVSIDQKASEISKQANIKSNDKQDVVPIIVEPEEKTNVETKTVTVAKTEIDAQTVTENKTEEKTTQAKPNITEKVVVPKEVTKEVVKIPEPKKQPNLVIKDDISGIIILSTNISIENKTVGEITLSQLDNRGINYSASGRGETVYFTMINSLKARGAGALSGWCYYVNGSKPGVSCGAYKLKSGDVVEWKYLEDAINN